MRILVVEDEKKGARFIKKAWALGDTGAEVVVGNLLELDAMHRVIAGGETMDFGMSVPDAYLAATVNAAVAKHHGVEAFISRTSARSITWPLSVVDASRRHVAGPEVRAACRSLRELTVL